MLIGSSVVECKETLRHPKKNTRQKLLGKFYKTAVGFVFKAQPSHALILLKNVDCPCIAVPVQTGGRQLPGFFSGTKKGINRDGSFSGLLRFSHPEFWFCRYFRYR